MYEPVARNTMTSLLSSFASVFSILQKAFIKEPGKKSATKHAKYGNVWFHVDNALHCFDWCKFRHIFPKPQCPIAKKIKRPKTAAIKVEDRKRMMPVFVLSRARRTCRLSFSSMQYFLFFLSIFLLLIKKMVLPLR